MKYVHVQTMFISDSSDVALTCILMQYEDFRELCVVIMHVVRAEITL